MAACILLLLALVLLAGPGPALSLLAPESCGLGPAFWCQDLATAQLCAAEELCQGLAQEGPQGDSLTPREGLGGSCWVCKRIIQKLENLVGEEPSQETITQAASQVCNKMKGLKGLCKKILKTFLRRISQDIMEGKGARDVCVDLKMCRPRAGLL
ncbi:granulysin [Choloepus didactylus]|uniref:granulysin n=1 Tax=Choloepus didactylus TaxID=27675 RepID=UPI00189E49BC|nr:granulysin [Choloepus didactylus]